MTATLTPIALPDTLAAGDQWRLVVSLSDNRAADGWAATLLLRGPNVLDVTGAPDPTTGDWVFTATAATTAPLIAGAYHAAVRVAKSPDVQTLPATLLVVSRNFATVTADQLLTHEEKAIPLLEAAILKRVTVDMAAYTITNRQATREQLKEMVDLLMRYRSSVARQQRSGFPAPVAVWFGRGY